MIEDSLRNDILATLYAHRADTLLQVCESFTALLPVTGAAIVEMSGVNRQEIVCATDDGSERLEALEFSLGEGPCSRGGGHPTSASHERRSTGPPGW